MTIAESKAVTENPPSERRRWPTADVGRAALVVFSVWFALHLFWAISSLVFLVFLATLLGLAVGRGVDVLQRYGIRRGVGSALIVFGTLGVIGGGLALSAPTLIEQSKELEVQFPAAVTKLQDWIDSKQKGGGATGALINAATQPTTPPPESAAAATAPTTKSGAVKPVQPVRPRPSEVIKQKLTESVSKAGGYLFSFVSGTLGVIAGFVLLIFLAIYIGAEPDVYRGWMLAAVPAQTRPQVRLVLTEVATVLRKWLIAQLVAMVVIGVFSTIVLLILGVRAPFALGFIAGLLEFIPNVGPVLSAVPAVLMGFADSPEKAVAVVFAYWGIQFLENNLLIPYLMRDEMDLPPAITLVAQAMMALLFGFIGLMVAVPLIAVVLVPVRMIAERENAREKEMRREFGRTAERRTPTASARMTAEYAVAEADRGPTFGDLSEDDFK